MAAKSAAFFLAAVGMGYPRAVVPSTVPPCSTGVPESVPWIDCQLDTSTFGRLPYTAASLSTTDQAAQALYDKAELCAVENRLTVAKGFDVMVEGGGYHAVWLETQPMAGGMYAARNLTLAVNNMLIFMRAQRQDGRLPGMIRTTGESSPGTIHPTYSYPNQPNVSMLQGFFMATPAVDTAWFLSLAGAPAIATKFLSELAPVLTRFDKWMWSARNSTHGVLWLNGTSDTGEDRSDRLKSIPSNPVNPPFESVDMMGYAHDAERALARIADIQGDTAASHQWKGRAATTAAALRGRLWRADRGACFDRERDDHRPPAPGALPSYGRFVDALVHNNLRAMWHGAFSQQMADQFIAENLMNRSKFWTPTPLTSIAASDPRFLDPNASNNWSGPPEGLTFQRTLRALEGYGHHAELLMIGALQREAILKAMRFTQQIDPFTSIPSVHGDCYGPMLLSSLEYTARTTGISVRPAANEILWTAADASSSFNFTQTIGRTVYRLQATHGGRFRGLLSGRQLFEGEGEVRVVTDPEGEALHVIGVRPNPVQISLKLPTSKQAIKLTVRPNEDWAVDKLSRATLVRRVPFRLPYN